MRKTNKLAGTYFCGNKASDYAIEQGYLDYATLSKAFDCKCQYKNDQKVENKNVHIYCIIYI